jgi:hypothetical protein
MMGRMSEQYAEVDLMAYTSGTVMFTMALAQSMHSRTFLVNQNPSRSLPAAVFHCLYISGKPPVMLEVT